MLIATFVRDGQTVEVKATTDRLTVIRDGNSKVIRYRYSGAEHGFREMCCALRAAGWTYVPPDPAPTPPDRPPQSVQAWASGWRT